MGEPLALQLSGGEARRQPTQRCGSVLTLRMVSGAEGSRTLDLLNAIQALSQLSYGPTRWEESERKRAYSFLRATGQPLLEFPTVAVRWQFVRPCGCLSRTHPPERRSASAHSVGGDTWSMRHVGRWSHRTRPNSEASTRRQRSDSPDPLLRSGLAPVPGYSLIIAGDDGREVRVATEEQQPCISDFS